MDYQEIFNWMPQHANGNAALQKLSNNVEATTEVLEALHPGANITYTVESGEYKDRWQSTAPAYIVSVSAEGGRTVMLAAKFDDTKKFFDFCYLTPDKHEQVHHDLET